jgi:hypothetical protein
MALDTMKAKPSFLRRSTTLCMKRGSMSHSPIPQLPQRHTSSAGEKYWNLFILTLRL